jgi:glycosyltransferase involved in cell wall biosynthesis
MCRQTRSTAFGKRLASSRTRQIPETFSETTREPATGIRFIHLHHSRRSWVLSLQLVTKNMRVLFVSSFFRNDPRTHVNGTIQRMRMFIDAIKEIAHLDILFYVGPDVDTSAASVCALERTLAQRWQADLQLFLCPRFKAANALASWQCYGGAGFSLFKQKLGADTSGLPQVAAFERCLERGPDAVFAHRLQAMSPPLLTRAALPPIFFDLDDIEHIARVRRIEPGWRWRRKLSFYLRIPALWWGEHRAMRLAHRTFVCSELDRDYLAQRWRAPRVAVVPNAVRVVRPLPLTPEPTLLFLATYRYRPNAQAAEFLIEQIWPRVHRVRPDARLIIAGANPEHIRNADPPPAGVEVTGFVEDLEALYRRSRVVCCPVLAGGGTRIKIIEAAAHRKATVATRIGAEGLDMRDGVELLLRDEAPAFAEACLQLLSDSTLYERLASAAYATAVQRYERTHVIRSIQRYLRE